MRDPFLKRSPMNTRSRASLPTILAYGSFIVTCLMAVIPIHAQSTEATSAPAADWPREIVTTKGVIVMYQPQPESLEGDTLRGRAAVSIELTDMAPVFGAVWFEARLETDRSDRSALITGLKVTEVRFPNQDDLRIATLSNLLADEVPKWNLPLSLDSLIATLELAEIQAGASKDLSTEAPIILFYNEPAILISIDGEPRLIETEEQGVQRVVNTPFTLLFEETSKTYFLNADVDSWYTSSDLQAAWQTVENVPAHISRLAPEVTPEDTPEDQEIEKEIEFGPVPKIVVVTEPTELISCTDIPEYTPLDNTDLLFISNTDSDVLMHTTAQEYYILLSGRWYVGKSLEGPWAYRPVTDLPDDFKEIPEDSELGTVLYAVPGTDVAREAVLDAQVPQTAAIERKNANLTVEYDGEPTFEGIDGTAMQWAVNTATPVIQVQKTYYAVDEAVWFLANSPEGPWIVATSVPDEIYSIPPESPVYNVTFVRVYGVNEDIVYVGYTPGYTHTYVYNTTIVYGTGYYWPGWYGRYYYPRSSTWGFHVRWNPWTGWRFGLSYSTGPFTFRIGGGSWYRGGWWGPGRYRGYRNGYRHGRRAGYRAGYRAGQRNAARNNMYRSSRNQNRTTTPSSAARSNAKSSAASSRAQAGGAAAGGGRPNNVYTDKGGNVYRQTDQGWQQRSGDSWQSMQGQGEKGQQAAQQKGQQKNPSATQSNQRATQSNRSSTSDLNRSASARQQGNQRANSYRSSGGGGRRGGGGGGRRR